MLTKENKKEIVKELGNEINDSKSVVFVNFHKLSVLDSGALRRSLRDSQVKFKVLKKTLVKRVLDGMNVKGERPEFKNELALAYLPGAQDGDVIAPARGVYEFQKKLDGKVSIMGGIFDGKYMSKVEMTDIATIPPIDVLRGMFVNIINSPIQRFAVALGQIAEKK